MDNRKRMKAVGDLRMVSKDAEVGAEFRKLLPVSDDIQPEVPIEHVGLRVASDGTIYMKVYGEDETAVVDAVLISNKATKVSGATAGNLASLTSGGDLADSGYAASDFDAAGSAAAAQAAAIASLGGADGTVTDEQLRNWAGQMPGLMTAVTRTNRRKSWIGTDGRTKYAGWIQVTGTVTWPDGTTGHLDGVEYPESAGVLQYFTASHTVSGKIANKLQLGFGVAGIGVVSPDYFVDSEAAPGGDGTLASPFSAISDLSLASGDIVALKSGSVFQESITPPAVSAYYRYGPGEKPVLDQRDTVDSWTKTPGYTNVYQATITIGGGFSQAFEDDSVLTYQSSLAALDSAPAGFYVSGKTAGSITIYIHTSSSDDPTTNGRTYKATVRLSGISGLGVANVLVDGLRFLSNTEDNGAVVVGRSSILRHCDFEDGTKHSALMADGASIYGCTFTRAQYDVLGLSPFVFNESTPAGLGVTIDACSFALDTYTSGAVAIIGHQNTSGSFGDVVVTRCYTDTLNLQSIQECDTLTISGTVIVDAGPGTLLLSTTVIEPYILSVARDTAAYAPGATGISINVFGGYLHAGAATNGFVSWSHTGTTVKYIGSVFDTKNTAIARAFYPLTSSTTIVIQNCQFIEAAGGQWTYSLFTDTKTPILAMNGNVYAGVQSWRYNSTQYSTIADWRAATGQDGASIAY